MSRRRHRTARSSSSTYARASGALDVGRGGNGHAGPKPHRRRRWRTSSRRVTRQTSRSRGTHDDGGKRRANTIAAYVHRVWERDGRVSGGKKKNRTFRWFSTSFSAVRLPRTSVRRSVALITARYQGRCRHEISARGPMRTGARAVTQRSRRTPRPTGTRPECSGPRSAGRDEKRTGVYVFFYSFLSISYYFM